MTSRSKPDRKISEVMRQLRARVKHPYAAFKEMPGLASQAGKTGWTDERRAAQRERIKVITKARHVKKGQEAPDTPPEAETAE